MREEREKEREREREREAKLLRPSLRSEACEPQQVGRGIVGVELSSGPREYSHIVCMSCKCTQMDAQMQAHMHFLPS